MKYIFFDLDETLSDHKYACQRGIEALMELYPVLRAKSVEQLEFEFWQLLNSNYTQVLKGNLSMNNTRIDRIAALFRGCDCDPPTDIENLVQVYINYYNKAHRAIPGIAEVLKKLKENNYQIVVITNGFKEVQHKKLDSCKLTPYIDMIITSEEIGVAKPDYAIYKAALDRCNVKPNEVIMIGDSWENDILCAHELGIKTIWLNRRNEKCPNSTITHIIYEPLEILNYLDLKSIGNIGTIPSFSEHSWEQ
jgi:HAD superfamily hydrolase (TIGR01549 family)